MASAHLRPMGFRFDNGFGASVAAEKDAGLFEVAVLGADSDVTYATIGPNGIYRYVTEDGVRELLNQIAALPAEDA